MRLEDTKLLSQALQKFSSFTQKLKGQIWEYARKYEGNTIAPFKHLSETNYQLGIFHLRAHNVSDAEFRFRLVLYFNLDNYKALYQLARCLYAKNKIKSAEKKLKKSLSLEPRFAEAEYLLSIIADEKILKKIPNSVIEEYYDEFAGKFDEEFSPANGYKLPKYLNDWLIYNLQISDMPYKILDIGCGTGHCSQHLYSSKLKIDKLTGIDLSANMLKAAQKITKDGFCIFDTLIKADYADFLSKTQNKYDIIIAGLSLHFQKDLSETLSKMKAILRKEGLVAFSVEKAFDQGVEAAPNYSFENFCYSKSYVEKAVEASQLKLQTITEYPIKNDRLALVVICKN